MDTQPDLINSRAPSFAPQYLYCGLNLASKGNILSESYYNDENTDEPITLSSGVHKIICTYDALSHETERSLYGLNESLIRREVKTYNTLGKLASIETYDSDGNPFVDPEREVFKIVYAYDSYGNISDYWYFDSDGKPCMRMLDGRISWHHLKHSYDAMGNILSEEIFDTEEKPCTWNGAHKILGIYNSYGLRCEEIYYDDNQNFLKKLLINYDSEGNKTGTEWIYN